ncbi:MAG: hypothetical protein CMK09_07070 [Ponticaulis sp.]|nr:hypothetical protein [Ponticaulis sp.]|tara:strand:- start:43695 stop:44342 length:648 start_codon:yes stop_codon:yes gene_type:complete
MAETNKTEFSGAGRRIVASFIPAAGLTLGLFVVMDRLVDVGEIVLPEPEFRTLASLTPPKDEPEEPDREKRDRFEPIEAAPPPKTDPLKPIEPGSVSFQVAEFRVPDVGDVRGKMAPIIQPVAVMVRERATPVRAPIPDYPQRALTSGLEGQCDVVFNIDAAGRPYDVEAECTDRIFLRSSENAVSKSLFAAKLKNGVPVGQENLVYPIQFTLND